MIHKSAYPFLVSYHIPCTDLHDAYTCTCVDTQGHAMKSIHGPFAAVGIVGTVLGSELAGTHGTCAECQRQKGHAANPGVPEFVVGSSTRT